MNHQKASASVILAGVLWGTISIFIRHLNAGGLSSLQISLIRMAVSATCFVGVVLITGKEKLKIHPKDIWMFVGTGIVSVVMFNVCYFYTIVHSQASVAVVLLYTSPIFIVLISALLFHERITKRKLTALLMTFAGCVFVAGLFGGGYQVSPLYLLTGLGSGLFYALYTVFGRFALKKYDTVTVTAYTFLFGFAGTVPLGKVGQTASLIKAQPSLLLWGIGVGIICTVLPYFFYTWGLQRMESGKAAILVAVEPLVGAVIGMTLLSEDRSPWKIFGIVLILTAILLLNTEKSASPEPEREKANSAG